MVSAVVVGSGPNGLAAAITLARADVDVTVLEAADTIGGGSRSAELTLPGLVHDVCAAAHPTALTSPFLRSLDLTRHGLEWAWADVEVAHPLDGGHAALLQRDLGATADGFGEAGRAWARAVRPLTQRLDALAPDILGPMLTWPDRPLAMTGFGAAAALPASWIARTLGTGEPSAAFAGLAAHAIRPLNRPGTAGIGLFFAAMVHRHGFPVAVGGSHAIVDALASVLRDLGGRIETGRRVSSIPDADVVFFDTSPRDVLTIAGERLDGRVRRSLARWEYGPGAFKIDLAVEGGIPWRNPRVGQAGTVHVGGAFAEIAAAERDVHAGRMPRRPFVLLTQQHVADPGRSSGGVHPISAYAHVPHGFDGDARGAIVDQIERFAPGMGDRIVAESTAGPAELMRYNANYVGGDIAVGANSLRQIVARPRWTPRPYTLSRGRMYLCSSATPPGGGVHGMCGHHAATAGLADLGILR